MNQGEIEAKKRVEMKAELQRLHVQSDQWRMAAQVLQSLAGVYKHMSEVCKEVTMERMNFEREMFAVEAATGAAGSVDASVTEHLVEMYKEVIRMVSSEKEKLEKSLQEFMMAAEVYRLEMEAKVKAKSDELWALSSKKAELESKIWFLEAELIAALPNTGELEDLKREKAPLFTLIGEQAKQWEQWQKMKGSESSKTTSDGPVLPLPVTLVTLPTMPTWAKEKRTGRVIGTGVRRNGLWFINQAGSALAAAVEAQEKEVFLLHRRGNQEKDEKGTPPQQHCKAHS